MYAPLLLRDLLFAALLLSLWVLFAPLSAGSDWLADFVGTGLGLLTALGFYLFHEWGHVLGGLLGRSKMSAAPSLKAIALFVYHSDGNSKAQFLLMSVSGFVATALLVWFAFTQLNDQYLATRIARGFTLVQVFLLIVIELPLVIWAVAGKTLPPIDATLDITTIKGLLANRRNQ